MLTLKEYRAMKEKSLRVFRRWEILKAGRGMLWRKGLERQRCLLLQCGVIPAVGSPSTSLQMLFTKHRKSCSRNPVDQKGPEEMDNLCGAWKHMEVGEMEGTLMNMALLLEKEEERPPRQLSPGSSLCVLLMPACRAGGGEGSGWLWCKAMWGSHGAQDPLTGAAPGVMELQPHWGRVQRPPDWDLHAKGSRQGRSPYPSWPRHLLFPVTTTLNQLQLCPELAEQMDDVPLLQGWFEGNHWVICHHCCLQDSYLSPGSERKWRRWLLHPQSHQ